jgi:hypothetical protein
MPVPNPGNNNNFGNLAMGYGQNVAGNPPNYGGNPGAPNQSYLG